MNTPLPRRAAVRLSGVGKTWTPANRAPVQALRDIELDIAPGEFVVFLGPSGCGKSTLLYMIAGLEPASAGTMEADGLPITGPSAERGLIFQDASLFPWLTILDNVAFGLSIGAVQKLKRREIAAEMLRRVGLGRSRCARRF
jgi:NitT/TauT family transport system ATP-binding protein